MKKAIIITLISISAQTSLADYHYASHEGSNTYPYTSWATATDSIKYAIAAADPGDTVYIGAGEYYERVVTAAEDSNLAVIGSGIDSTYWWWDVWSIPTYKCADNTLVENIHFSHTITISISTGIYNSIVVRNCLFTEASGILIYSGGGTALIENCIFRLNPAIGEAVEVWDAPRADIRNCLVDGCETAFFQIAADTAIIKNNIIIDCTSTAIWPWFTNDSTLVINNLIYHRVPESGVCWDCPTVVNTTFDNIAPGWGAIHVFNPVSTTYVNNSVSRASAAFFLHDGSPWNMRVSYYNLWDVDSLGLSHHPVTWDTVGIQWADPMYAGVEDFHLQAFSPLIDAGDPSILDVDGSRSDIGVYGGPGGESYQYPDLPPAIPDSLSAEVSGDSIILYWRFNTEADFNRYYLHRDTISGFQPTVFNLLAEPDSSYYVDTDWMPGRNYYYLIAAIDDQDNISDYSGELAVILTGINPFPGAEVPFITAIETSYPNPFNSVTTIIYKVANMGPVPAQIDIDIYDILGRKVRNLIDERREVGIHRVIWDGRDDLGAELPSGVYFARIEQWGVSVGGKPRKLILMK